MLRFVSLGSGSRGNATLVESSQTRVLVDCGFSIKETVARLHQVGREPEQLDAILVTHEHSDHIKGVAPFARRYNLPVFMTHGTSLSRHASGLPVQHEINLQQSFTLGDLEIEPVAVPHDAREPCQFLFESAGKRLGVLTDLGSITPFVVDRYRECDGLMLECNHDSHMLAVGPYPHSLKQRVGGAWGHLNNHQAAQLLWQIDQQRLQRLVLSHISEKNNTVELARQTVEPDLSAHVELLVAEQERPVGWVELD